MSCQKQPLTPETPLTPYRTVPVPDSFAKCVTLSDSDAGTSQPSPLTGAGTPNTIPRTQPFSYHAARAWLLIAIALFGATAGGCRRDATPEQGQPTAVEPKSTNVPLRVWVVTQHFDREAVHRQWKAVSEQPVEFRVMSEQDLLDNESPEADLIVFPARLLGEMVHRKWIIKLPQAWQSQSAQTGQSPDDPNDQTTSAGRPTEMTAERVQASYGGIRYGASLGVSVPVVIASGEFSLDENDERIAIQQLLDALPSARQAPDQSPEEIEIDPDAIVDRFLTLVGFFTERSSKYGILFEMQTMRSRLQEEEFRRAANALQRLASQPNGGWQATLGSHSTAWQWVVDAESPAVAIASPTLIKDLTISNPQTRIIRLQGRSDFPAGWNTGGGLIAGIGAECRQTAQSLAFLDWLVQPSTRNALAMISTGIDPTSPPAGADSLAWRARRAVSETLASRALPKEPSLVGARRYRQALGRELISMLRGEKSTEQALRDAHEAWQTITDSLGPGVRDAYEKSLGLVL